jgi:hypothetical protein
MIQLAGCIRRGEAESSHQSGQHDFHFEHSVLLADAVARTGAERNEGVRMSSGAVLRKEAFRLELIRIFVNLRIAVHSVDQHGHGHTGRERVVTCFQIKITRLFFNEFNLITYRSIENSKLYSTHIIPNPLLFKFEWNFQN